MLSGNDKYIYWGVLTSIFSYDFHLDDFASQHPGSETDVGEEAKRSDTGDLSQLSSSPYSCKVTGQDAKAKPSQQVCIFFVWVRMGST